MSSCFETSTTTLAQQSYRDGYRRFGDLGLPIDEYLSCLTAVVHKRLARLFALFIGVGGIPSLVSNPTLGHLSVSIRIASAH